MHISKFNIMAPINDDIQIDSMEKMMFRTEFSIGTIFPDFVYKIEPKVYTDWDKECELLKEYLEYAIENSAIMIMHRFNETGMLIMPECYGFQNWKRHFNKY